MINAIEVHIITSNNTLRGDLSMLLPDDRDSRVLNKEYKIQVVNFGIHSGGMGIPLGSLILSASIKCHAEGDVSIILNNLKFLLNDNLGKIDKNSWIGIHSCNQVEDYIPTGPCSLEKIWSN